MFEEKHERIQLIIWKLFSDKQAKSLYGLFNHCSRTTENFRVAEVAMLSYGKPAD